MPNFSSFTDDTCEFTDDLHGRILLNRLERDCVDTPEFHRLFRLSQLGLVHTVFHTANHTRGIHSLGVCHQAKRLVDLLNRNTPRTAAARQRRQLPCPPLPEITPAERCLISLGALLHDIPHGPFSHDIEKKTHRYGPNLTHKMRSHYGPYDKHDDWTTNPALFLLLFHVEGSVLARVLRQHSPSYWELLQSEATSDRAERSHISRFVQAAQASPWPDIARVILPSLLFHLLVFETTATAQSGPSVLVAQDFDHEPRPWTLGPEPACHALHKAWYQPYRHDIVGNTLSADLLDYLARDAHRLGMHDASTFDTKLLEYYVLVSDTSAPERDDNGLSSNRYG